MPNTIKTRIQNKHDIEANWLKASGFIPLVGELIIYDAETQETFNAAYATLTDAQKEALNRTTPITYARVKIGDGKKAAKDLEFVDARIIETIDAIEVPTKVSDLDNDRGFITSIPTEYITETELNAKGYLTQHQDISGKADKEHTHPELISYGTADPSASTTSQFYFKYATE